MRIDDNQLLERTYELVKENNQMLRRMRRAAFFGGILKIIIWTALIVAPIWFYAQFIHPVMQSTFETVNQVQNTGAQFNAQLGEFGNIFEQIENIPGFGGFNQGE